MSWFDELFSNDKHSDEELLRRKNKRRHNSETQKNGEHTLLPENDDIYNRPRGKFRFPIDLGQDAETSDEAVYREVDEDEYMSQKPSKVDKDFSYGAYSYDEIDNNNYSQTYDSATDTRRRRRRQYTNHDDTGVPSIKERPSNKRHKSLNDTQLSERNNRKTTSQYQKHTNNHSHVKLQSERFKSNYKTTSNSTYHHSSFRTSEVPSAVFGTKKRRPIENGVIPPLKEKENDDKNNSKQNQTAQRVSDNDVKTNKSKSKNEPLSQTKYEDTDVSIINDQNSNIYETTFSKSKVPNFSQKDNTVNIENIYASQIVEEIRREREKKAQQKRKFKEALQNKRQQSADNDNGIQKVIDEMYANQARQYTGESSLDHKENNDDERTTHTEDSTDKMEDSNGNTTDNHVSDEETQTDSNMSNYDDDEQYQYEEIDLKSVPNIQTVKDKDVEIREVNDTTSKDKHNDEPLSDDNLNVAPIHSTKDKPHYLNKNDGAHLNKVNELQDDNYASKEEVEEAKYHEMNADVTKQSNHHDDDINHSIDNAIETDTEYASEQVEHNNDSVHDSPSTSNTEDEKLEDDDAQIVENENVSSSIKSSIIPGSRPFNVVMTPSDKKRLMDTKKFKKSNKISVPELKPETKLESKSVSTPSSSPSVKTTNNHEEDTKKNINEQSLQDHQEDETSELSNVQNENTQTISMTLNTQNEEQDDKEQHESKAVIRKGPNIKLPSLELLEDPEIHQIDDTWIEEKKQELNDAFYYFNVPAEVQNVTVGPSVTRFELAVEKGVKVSRITALQDDLKMALAAKDIRIEAPIPGTSLVGIEVPNQNSSKVSLKSILESPKFKNTESKLTVAMGNRINNEPLLMDIAKTPHALIAGATGSGKSVCINSILMSLLYKNHPEELRLLLIDPKMVELAPYNDLPHLVSPVITDVKAATQSLKWAVEEMERRYKLFAKYHVRNITAFNKKASYEQRMPKIVIVIDELADLMMMAPQEVEQSIARIAQKARACGIHMLVATQRPSVNVITGLIKANIPTRIAFMVSSSVDSRTIIDSGGAERLLGYGDMLYLGSGMNKPIRVQGTFVSDEEIDDVVDFIKAQREPEYLFEEKELLKKTQTQARDELFDDVCSFMVKEGHISTSLIQRHFQIGYNRAARIVDQLEQLDYISGANGSKPRDVFITETDLKKD
ncbi:DNA translocase FtsK [Staphylococcus sp. HMSC070D05]|uniref:DNA translocase FtsK n=1 Tax=Staphylococcus sp. HMSC070D05 TaxID=1739538 RepID=UPI0008A5E10E|nr:DNA translocase FtsK [Staphylococcus sp. HMSC070D05]OFO39953.1 cell division protein FtsK [Staphylococcus sp. HMSC070D05]